MSKKLETVDLLNPLALSWEAFVVQPMADFQMRNSAYTDMGDFEPSKTRQEFAEECDINTLMARYEAGGAISHVNKATPRFMDVTALPDLRGFLDVMREASAAFASLPAKVRKEFDHDPQKFVDFAQSPDNLEKMREWGLAPMPAVEAPPVKVLFVNELPPSADLGDPAVKPVGGKPPKG